MATLARPLSAHSTKTLRCYSLRTHKDVDAVPVHVTTTESHSQHTRVDIQATQRQLAEQQRQNARWWTLGGIAVLLAAVAVAAAVYVISARVPARYQSSATIRVSVQATTGISDPGVTAANDLASQFAQLASSAPVVTSAAQRLGVPSRDLDDTVTSGTIAAQNLVRISVTGSSSTQAQERATAVARSFVRYIDRIDAQQVASYESAVTSKLQPLAAEISAARKRTQSTDSEVQRNATVLLSGLLSQQQTVLNSIAQASAAAQPSLQLVAPGSSGTKVSPKPSLYAGVGLLATLLLLGRFLYVVGMRRTRAGLAPI